MVSRFILFVYLLFGMASMAISGQSVDEIIELEARKRVKELEAEIQTHDNKLPGNPIHSPAFGQAPNAFWGPAPASEPFNNLRISQIYGIDPDLVAVIHVSDKGIVPVRVGEEVEGWTVVSITNRAVKLKKTTRSAQTSDKSVCKSKQCKAKKKLPAYPYAILRLYGSATQMDIKNQEGTAHKSTPMPIPLVPAISPTRER